ESKRKREYLLTRESTCCQETETPRFKSSNHPSSNSDSLRVTILFAFPRFLTRLGDKFF
ncbi:heparan sulfate glucosamine 3-O-sulfotransferase 5 X2, partial [Biomphalaria glabrata]